MVGYYVLLEGWLSQTIGKMAVGIKVVAEATGQVPRITGAATRTVLRLIDGLFSYAVVFVTVLVSGSGNAWATCHDQPVGRRLP